MTIDEQFEKLENTVREYNPGADFKRIRESYEFAKQHHGEQRRAGEIRDPVARLIVQLGELGTALAAVIAAAFHCCGEISGASDR